MDVDILYSIFEKNADGLMNLGAYEGISKAWSVDYGGLVVNHKLLLALVQVCPTCNPHETALRKAMTRFLLNRPKANQTSFKGEIWIGLRVERVGVILHHLRKAAREKDFSAAVLRLPAKQVSVLKCLLDHVRVEGDGLSRADGSEVLALCDADMEEAGEETYPWDVPQTPPSVQKGEKRPRPQSPEVSFMRRRVGQKCGSPQVDREALQEALTGQSASRAQGTAKAKAVPKGKAKAEAKPKALPKAKAKAKANAKAKAQAKAGAKEKRVRKNTGSESAERRPWKRLVKTVASNPARCYLQGSHERAGKVKLITEVPATWSPHYVQIIEEIRDALQKDGLTKAEARDLRGVLVQRYNT